MSEFGEPNWRDNVKPTDKDLERAKHFIDQPKNGLDDYEWERHLLEPAIAQLIRDVREETIKECSNLFYVELGIEKSLEIAAKFRAMTDQIDIKGGGE